MCAADPPHLFGGYAEYCYLLPGVWVYKIPDDMPDKVAVLTDIFASTIGVRKGMMPYPVLKEGFGPGDTAVILGSGAIGIAAGITARLAGAYRVILVGGIKERLKLAGELGSSTISLILMKCPMQTSVRFMCKRLLQAKSDPIW